MLGITFDSSETQAPEKAKAAVRIKKNWNNFSSESMKEMELFIPDTLLQGLKGIAKTEGRTLEEVCIALMNQKVDDFGHKNLEKLANGVMPMLKVPPPGKQSRGALVFWQWFQRIELDRETADSEILKLSRALQVAKQRLDILEKVVDGHRQLLRKNEARVPFRCIVCGYEFGLPENEAEDLEGLSTCPECGQWAFLANSQRELAAKKVEKKMETEIELANRDRVTSEVASALGVDVNWVKYRARKYRFGRPLGKGPYKTWLYFTPNEFARLKQLRDQEKELKEVRLFDPNRQVG